ncbi:MAG: cation:proton antiporter [Patescibacteria group bacterium]
MSYAFGEVSVLIILASLGALILFLLRQPSILAYLLAGAIAGPLGFGLIKSQEILGVLSSFGIALLLFLVGLELDFTKLKKLGRTSLIIGSAQVIFTTLIGFFICRLLGVAMVPSFYIALALTFSSTIIIVKLFSDQGELNTLAGRIALSILLFQDIVALSAVVILGGLNQDATIWFGVFTLLRAVALVGVVIFIARYALKYLFSIIARSSELLMLTALAWCFVIVMSSLLLGLSAELGALIAGLALASMPYNLEISARLKSLRDFFLILFFVGLGSQLAITSLGTLQPLFWTLTAFVLIGNPIIVILIMSYLGYRRRTNLTVGLSMGMVSEFSLVLIALGVKLGHITNNYLTLIAAVAALSIAVTSYLMSHSDQIYICLKPWLKKLERNKFNSDEHSPIILKNKNHTVLFGCDRLGERILRTLKSLKHSIVVVDFNPDVVTKLKKQGVTCLYGDMSDLEVMEQLNLDSARMIISTVPDVADNLLLLNLVHKLKSKAIIYLTASTWHDCQELYQAGAHYVIFPHYLSAEHFSSILAKLTSPTYLKAAKRDHLAAITKHYSVK